MDVQKPSSAPSKWRKLTTNLQENEYFFIFCGMAFTFAFVAILFSLIYLIPDPRRGNNQLNFQVKNVSISPFNISGSKINFYLDVQFSVRNHLDKHVYYSKFISSLSYKNQIIAQNSIQPFNHPKNSQIPVNATFVAGDSSFSDKRLVNSLLVDMNTGVVTFDIAIKVDTDNIYVASADAICKDVTMWISSHGGVWKLSGGTKQCVIYR
ncbi:hypothetical protein LguiA_012440 [Lonicera macranthoides]